MENKRIATFGLPLRQGDIAKDKNYPLSLMGGIDSKGNPNGVCLQVGRNYLLDHEEYDAGRLNDDRGKVSAFRRKHSPGAVLQRQNQGWRVAGRNQEGGRAP